MKTILVIIIFCSVYTWSCAQDTISISEKPQVIIKSWYPEFKELPPLKIGESKILFASIPSFKSLPIRNYSIKLKTSNNQVEIKETDKLNQYLVTVNPTDSKFIEFELW